MAEVVVVNKLKPLAERIQRLEEEKKNTAEMIKEVFAEAKTEGFDVAALRKALSDLKKNESDVSDFQETVQMYRDALA